MKHPINIATSLSFNCELVNKASVFGSERAKEQIRDLMKRMPHGGGYDRGVEIDLDKSGKHRLVFTTDIHNMNEAGYYDGWSSYTITVTPCFGGTNIIVRGRSGNRAKYDRDNKERILYDFDYVLNSPA